MRKFILGLFLIPLQATAITVKIQQAVNYTESDKIKLNRAVQAIETVVNSNEFKNRVLNFTYQGQKTFVQNNGLSNQAVYDLLMTGTERFPNQTTADQEIDLFLQLYRPKWYQSKNVVGYTSPSYATVYVNSIYYRNAKVSDIADNMVHEWLHKVGFDHDYKSTARRPYSVPYAIGYIVDDLIVEWGLN